MLHTGGDLILVGRNAKKLADQQKEVRRKYNVTAHIIDVDLSQPDAAQKIYDTCKKNGWTIDYLINNAGFGGQGEFIKRSMEQDMSMIAVNIETPTRLTKLFLPDFVKRGRYFKPFTTLLKHTLQAGQMRYGVKYKAQALR
ncbi:SDR family NAD(P)-dependent oxidoreductase [Lactobacillus crispatus]|uniref:SDR family NAD(P)-dependent oxidoreductase n=1 Tax=Lactobacillus crispatus TaxID=47770 RepID=UPI001CC6C5C9|nr:SDR family NAD(P)-dependent oxidoreductase [Lactobacillus crispatus]